MYKLIKYTHNYYKIFLCFLTFLCCYQFVWYQSNFTIQSTIYDKETHKPLAGIEIKEKGTKNQAVSNEKGQFSLKVFSSNSVIDISSIGYYKIEIMASKVASSIYLKSSVVEIEAVQVQTSKRVDTEWALLEERRKAGIIQDGISAELINRTASITATQALQRVVGVTVTDEKYVAVRGMGDRAVIAQLNGSRLASSNPDRSAIPLDLVPAALLDNITVYKSYTPDKPADAASGIINLKTKSIPDTMLLEFIVQTGLNSNIGIGGSYNSFWNSGMGILGNRINSKNLSQDFLNLSNQYPNGLKSIQNLFMNANYSTENYAEVERINRIMQSFDPVLTTKFENASPNQLYTLNFGNKYAVFGGKHTVGLILSGNYYRRKTDIYQGDLTQWSIYQGVVTGNRDVYSYRNIPNYITPNNLNMGKYQTYKENTGNETLNYGILGGLAYRFSPQHEIGFQFLGSWGGENQATNMNGGYEYSGLPGYTHSNIFSLKQTFRNLYTYNFQGEHKFGKQINSPRLSYSGSNSVSKHSDPDYRYASLVDFVPNDPDWSWYLSPHILGDYDDKFINANVFKYSSNKYAFTSGYVNGYGPYGIIQAEPNGRRWRNLDEINFNYKADFALPVTLFGQNHEFKFGGDYLNRSRRFNENHLFLPGANLTGTSSELLYQVNGDLDRLVSNHVVGLITSKQNKAQGAIPETGFLYNIFKSPNNYRGFYEVQAYYGMADLKLGKKLRVTGGLRFESTDIGSIVDTSNVFLDPSLSMPNADGKSIPLVYTEPNSLYRTGFKPYYSVNMIYILKEGYMNLRGGYNTTLARPELREITNVFEYDAVQMGLVVGNPMLKNQHTQNLDFRWEWFTGKGEVLAFSVFGKRIQDQLVKVFSLKTHGLSAVYPEFPVIRFENEQHIGHVWGVEMEAVQNLGDFWSGLEYFFLGSNLMLCQSNIVKSDLRYLANKTLDRHTPKNSPLFEQAPYSFNGWLNFTQPVWGSDFTLTFNTVGERLVQINLLGEPDLYTQPVPMLDFVWSQNITKKLIFKGFVKNILNPSIKTVYSNPGTGGLWYNNEYIHRSFKRGAEIMFGLTYKLF